MKKITATFLALLFIFSGFAQNVDFVNAPLNPTTKYAPLREQNLKGDIFQFGYLNFDRKGIWIPYKKTPNATEVTRNDLGRVVNVKKSYRDVTYYDYDDKGNLIEVRTNDATQKYTYDFKNRLIAKSNISTDNAKSGSQYSYSKREDLLIVNQVGISVSGQKYNTEIHFKNGLEVYAKSIGYPATITQYEFDHKGNWIKLTAINADTKKNNLEPIVREFIYYDEYDMGFNAIGVITEKLAEKINLLVPKTYIGSKNFIASSSRFVNDFVFYDRFSKTYYIARGAYNANNIEGKKHLVEILSTGHEIMLLSNGNNLQVINQGEISSNKTKFAFTTYYRNYIARDTLAGAAFSFGQLAVPRSPFTIATPGKDMLENATSVWYIYNTERKSLILFDRGKSINTTISGYTGVNNDLVLALNNTPKYVLTGYQKVADKTITQGRYFNPNTDTIKTTEE